MTKKIKVYGESIELTDNTTVWKFDHRPGGWVIASCKDKNGKTIRKRIYYTELQKNFWVNINGKVSCGKFEDTRKSSSATQTNDDLVAQFPGKVRKILVEEGDQVKEGESLILIEAMKMEFTIKAPFAGIIKEVLVKAGQQLSPGDVYFNMKA